MRENVVHYLSSTVVNTSLLILVSVFFRKIISVGENNFTRFESGGGKCSVCGRVLHGLIGSQNESVLCVPL